MAAWDENRHEDGQRGTRLTAQSVRMGRVGVIDNGWWAGKGQW